MPQCVLTSVAGRLFGGRIPLQLTGFVPVVVVQRWFVLVWGAGLAMEHLGAFPAEPAFCLVQGLGCAQQGTPGDYSCHFSQSWQSEKPLSLGLLLADLGTVRGVN